MARASFTKGFAKAQLDKKRSPMVAKIETPSTVINFETSFPNERVWQVWQFLSFVSNANTTPQQAFDKAFGKQ